METNRSPLETLVQALGRSPDRVEAIDARKLLLESARQNDKRPAYLKVAVPDEMAKAARGKSDQGDLVLLVRVPRDVVERGESRIVLPGEI